MALYCTYATGEKEQQNTRDSAIQNRALDCSSRRKFQGCPGALCYAAGGNFALDTTVRCARAQIGTRIDTIGRCHDTVWNRYKQRIYRAYQHTGSLVNKCTKQGAVKGPDMHRLRIPQRACLLLLEPGGCTRLLAPAPYPCNGAYRRPAMRLFRKLLLLGLYNLVICKGLLFGACIQTSRHIRGTELCSFVAIQ